MPLLRTFLGALQRPERKQIFFAAHLITIIGACEFVCKAVLFLITLCAPGAALAASMASNGLALSSSSTGYFWRTTNVSGQAQLITLFCGACNASAQLENNTDIPLISVMRDTLGDEDPKNDRLTAIWLLTYIRPSLGRQALSAVPFFYWRVNGNSPKVKSKLPSPLLDMTSPQHPIFGTLGRDILQWGLLDSVGLPVRASSRAYRSNEADNERLHLEEAENYLRSAPPAGNSGSALSQGQIQTLIARLELRKTLLGGLADETAAKRLGAEDRIEFNTVRSKNWELLRQWADKTGLSFDPIPLARTSGQYAILWYPLDDGAGSAEPGPHAIWKLLGVKRPSKDLAGASRRNGVYLRNFDELGNMLPFDETGVRQSRFIPLGVYSLTYPKRPLLVLDFRTGMHLRLKEISQRSINEVTAGVIGISHFTNWYYYVAAAAYDFVASRRGGAMDQYERLDSYAQFRASLQLDNELDPRLRSEMQRRIGMLSVNPLESDPRSEMRAAVTRYDNLQRAAADGKLATMVDNDRRAELAQDRDSPKQLELGYLLHLGTLGVYTRRAAKQPSNQGDLNAYRRAAVELAFLDSLVRNGTAPEVAYEASQIERSVASLHEQLPRINSRAMDSHAEATLGKLDGLSRNPGLKQECAVTLASLHSVSDSRRPLDAVALEPAAIRRAPSKSRLPRIAAEQSR